MRDRIGSSFFIEQRRTAEFSRETSPDQGQKLKNGHPSSPFLPPHHRRHPVSHERHPTTPPSRTPIFPEGSTIADTHFPSGHRERPPPMPSTHRAQREQHNLVRREKPLRSAFGAGLYADTHSPRKPAKPVPRPGRSSTAIPTGPSPGIAPVLGSPNRRHPNSERRTLQLQGRCCCLPGRCAAARVQGGQEMGVFLGGADQLRATTVGSKAQLPIQKWPWRDP